MSTEDAQAQIAGYAVDLRKLHRAVGAPSYRRMNQKLAHGFSVSTICRAFQGERLPSWEFVHAFLVFCDVPDVEITGTWRPRWVRIQNIVDPLPETAVEPQPVGGTECVDCGSWVTNMDRHAEWHKAFVPRQRHVVTERRLRPVDGRVRHLAG